MPVNSPKQNGWNEWSKHVLKELERHNALMERLIDDMNNLNNRITILEVKSGIWGVLGGALTVALYFLIQEMKGP